MKAIVFLFSTFFLFLNNLAAQSNDFLRSTGKINAVVVVISIVFIGIIIYLIKIDQKISKLENQINNEQ